MTAVHGIDLLPRKESEQLPAKEAKNKGEVSPFERLLTRNNKKNESKIEDTALKEEKNISPVKDGPKHPSFYSTEKLSALLKKVTPPAELAEIKSAHNEGLPVVDIKSEQDITMPAVLRETEGSLGDQGEDIKKILALLLKGELNSEELEKLLASYQNLDMKMPSPVDISPDLINLEEEVLSPGEISEKTLNGVLTEEGELIYFNETILKEGERALKESQNAKLTIMDQPKNRMVVEISVTDLRDSKNLSSLSPGVSIQENQALSNVLEGKKEQSLDSDKWENLFNTATEKLISAEGAGGKLQAPVTREVAQLFQNYMKEKGNGDLVKKMDFILKNSNQGEIKLILKPEALGNVRINLSLNENHIAGKIFVDNSSVRDIFLNNMEQIINQLKANGYDEATLDVWVGQEGKNGQKGKQQSDQDKKYRVAERVKRFDQSVPQAAPGSYINDGAVNLVV